MKPGVLPRRKNIRLPGFDYSSPGGYFVTICARYGLCLFDPAPVRFMLQEWWAELPHKFSNLELDEFVVMPNHIHGIIVLKGLGGHTGQGRHTGPPLQDPAVRADLRVGPPDQHNGPPDPSGGHTGPPLPNPTPLPAIIQWFKTMTTNAYIRGVKQSDWKPFPGKLWHRTYYEHIIRDDHDLARIRQYIRDNPLNWVLDRNNPSNNPNPDTENIQDDLKTTGL